MTATVTWPRSPARYLLSARAVRTTVAAGRLLWSTTHVAQWRFVRRAPPSGNASMSPGLSYWREEHARSRQDCATDSVKAHVPRV